MRKISSVLVYALSAFIILSCTTTGIGDGGRTSVVAKLVDQKELLKEFGVRKTENPYTPPVTMLLKPVFEFIVVSVEVSSQMPVNIKIESATVIGSKNESIAKLLTSVELHELWLFYGKPEMLYHLYDKIDRSYIPSTSYKAKTGKSRRLLVFSGAYPIKKPCTISLTLLVDGVETAFDLMILEK